MMYIGGRVLIAQCSAMSLFVAWVVTLECCSICCCGSGLVRMKRGPKRRIGGPPLLPRGFSRPFLPPIGYVLTNHSSAGWPNASRRAFETVRLLVHGSSIHPRADPLSFQIFLHFFFFQNQDVIDKFETHGRFEIHHKNTYMVIGIQLWERDIALGCIWWNQTTSRNIRHLMYDQLKPLSYEIKFHDKLQHVV